MLECSLIPVCILKDKLALYFLIGKEKSLEKILVLGDPAYPLLPWLLKVFIDNGSLTSQQKLFNYRLSKARVVVEHASLAMFDEEE